MLSFHSVKEKEEKERERDDPRKRNATAANTVWICVGKAATMKEAPGFRRRRRNVPNHAAAAASGDEFRDQETCTSRGHVRDGYAFKLLRIAAWAAQRGYETEPTLPEGSRHKPHGCVPPLLGFDVTSCGV